MKHLTIIVTLAILAINVSAQQPALRDRDPNIDMLAYDLRTLARVTDVAEDLEKTRQVQLAIVDGDIRTLRIPREDGTYQWAALQREEGGRRTEEVTIEQAHTEPALKTVSLAADHGYRVLITVPQKRGIFTANNRVWIRNVLVASTGFDGKVSNQQIAVNAWVDPGDANGVALPEIARTVRVTAELGVESGSKRAVAEVAVLQARLVDDGTSPYYPAVQKLLAIRELLAARDMNRGTIRTALDEALLSLPGELETRTAEQEETARVRRQMVEMGLTTGAIALGDATPDVVHELAAIARLMNGTVDEQTEGRTRLGTLIETLRPKPVTE